MNQQEEIAQLARQQGELEKEAAACEAQASQMDVNGMEGDKKFLLESRTRDLREQVRTIGSRIADLIEEDLSR